MGRCDKCGLVFDENNADDTAQHKHGEEAAVDIMLKEMRKRD